MSYPISTHPHLRVLPTVTVTSVDFPDQGEMVINRSEYEANPDAYELVKAASSRRQATKENTSDPETDETSVTGAEAETATGRGRRRS